MPTAPANRPVTPELVNGVPYNPRSGCNDGGRHLWKSTVRHVGTRLEQMEGRAFVVRSARCSRCGVTVAREERNGFSREDLEATPWVAIGVTS